MVSTRILLTSLAPSSHGEFSMSIHTEYILCIHTVYTYCVLNLKVKRAPKHRAPTFRIRHQFKGTDIMMSPTL